MHVCGELVSADLDQTKIPIQKITLPGEAFPLQLCDNRCVTHLTQIPAVIASKPVHTFVRRFLCACKNNTSQLHENGTLHFIRLNLLFFDILFVLESVHGAYLLNS